MSASSKTRGLVAIVGRPNVGKSTLFNRLVGSRRAIVDDTPGVTRDRQYGIADWYERKFTVIDTGGFEPDSPDPLLGSMREQAQLAIDEADVILFVVDARAGVTAADAEISEMLRLTHKPVFTLANKVEGRAAEQAAMEVYELGASNVHLTSGEHGIGIPDVMEEVVPLLPDVEDEEEEEGRLRVAIIGRPNVGKSSIVNRLLGTERLLASEVPGTTRDSIDTPLDLPDGRRFLLVDTAGIRRKRSISLRVERYSVVQSIQALDRAHVAALVLDAAGDFADQDARLAHLVMDRGRPCVVAINKWDAVEKDTWTAGGYVKAFREKMPELAHVPIVFVSAKSGQRVHKLLDELEAVYARSLKRIGTGELNRFFRDVAIQHAPPSHKSRLVKFYYVRQVSSEPPTLVVSTNFPEAIPASYRRYVLNQLREHYDLAGVPLRVLYRKRTRRVRGPDGPAIPLDHLTDEELQDEGRFADEEVHDEDWE